MQVSWAVQTVLWGRELTNLRLTLRTIRAAGYAGVEIAQAPQNIIVDPSTPATCRPPLDGQELDEICREERLKFLGLSGGSLRDRLRFCGRFRPPYLYTDTWNADCEANSRVPLPFVLGLHPHLFMPLGSLEPALTRVKQEDRRFAKLLPDTAHLTIMERDPAKVIREWANTIVAIHLKDWSPEFGRFSHRYARGFCMIGDGIVDTRAVFDAVADASWSGWIVVEQDAYVGEPYDCLRTIADRLRSMSHDVGFPKRTQEEPRPAPHREREYGPLDSVDGQFLGKIASAGALGLSNCLASIPRCLCTHPLIESSDIWSVGSAADHIIRISSYGEHWNHPLSAISQSTPAVSRAVQGHEIVPLGVRAGAESEIEFAEIITSDKVIIFVPVLNTSNPHHCRYVLTLAVNHAEALTLLAQKARLYYWSTIIARTVDCSIDQECTKFMGKVVYAATVARSRDEFIQGLILILVEALECEGVAIFLRDDSGDRLELAGTTGTEWFVPEPSRHYRAGDGLTGRVWQSRGIEYLGNLRTHPNRAGKSAEIVVSSERDECMFVCLAERDSPALGVLRVTNKLHPRTDGASTMFTDDDAAVADAIIAAACPYLSHLVTALADKRVLTALTHELKMPLVAIMGATRRIERALRRASYTEKELFGKNYVSDIREWIALSEAQIDNADIYRASATRLILRVQRCLILRDIIAPAVNQAKLVLLGKDILTNPVLWEAADSQALPETEQIAKSAQPGHVYYSRFEAIPELYLDKHLMRQVVFNLLGNAVKYGAGEWDFKVYITGTEVNLEYVILFQDWGPGINPELLDLVFQAGYRAPEQERTHVPGQGIGLAIVRSIVEAHGAIVSITHARKPLTFALRFPKRLKSYPPISTKRVQVHEISSNR